MSAVDSLATELPRYRLKVGSVVTPGAQAWWYEVLDTWAMKGARILVSGLRRSWETALQDGLAALRYVTGNRALGFE